MVLYKGGMNIFAKFIRKLLSYIWSIWMRTVSMSLVVLAKGHGLQLISYLLDLIILYNG